MVGLKIRMANLISLNYVDNCITDVVTDNISHYCSVYDVAATHVDSCLQ